MKSIEITVANENLGVFSAKLSDINTKFAKKGFPLIRATLHNYIPKEDDADSYIAYMNETYNFFTVESEWDGLNLADEPCDFQGTVNFVELGENDSRIITCENEEVASILRNSEMVCDCCSRDIVRGKYLAFLKKDKPICRENVIILGRNCAKNYFPFNVDLYFMGLETVFDELIEEYNFDHSICSHRESHYDFDWLAFCVGKVTNNFTVYNKMDGDDRPTRCDFIDYETDYVDKFGNHFRDNYKNIEVMDIDEIKRMLIDAYKEPSETNEFALNIHSVLFDSENNIRSEINRKYVGIAIYAFVGARRAMNKAKTKELERQTDKKSEYVGNVGDKFEMELIYIKSIWFESQFGYSAFHFFKDNDGNVFKWSSAKNIVKIVENKNGFPVERECESGEKVVLKGSIKAHDEYKEVKQTVITRCKIVA